jgi:hypothetical protein
LIAAAVVGVSAKVVINPQLGREGKEEQQCRCFGTAAGGCLGFGEIFGCFVERQLSPK